MPRRLPGGDPAVEHRRPVAVAQVVEREPCAGRQQGLAVEHHPRVVGHAEGLEHRVERGRIGELVRHPVALDDERGEREESRAGDVPRVVAGAVPRDVQDDDGGVGQLRRERCRRHEVG